MKPTPPDPNERSLYDQRLPTRKERLRLARNSLSQAVHHMKAAGYAAADTALELAEQALRQLTEDIQVTDD